MNRPVTHYAKSGDVHLAYQTVGEGPMDLMLLSMGAGHVEHQWEYPPLARFFERLAGFSRLIMFDVRGSGLSDRSDRLPLLEEQVEDIVAVLDAVGSERAAVFGVSQTGAMAILFAAIHPERCTSLVLYGAFARALWAPDYPWGRRPEIYATLYELIEQAWGTGVMAHMVATEHTSDPEFMAWWSRYERVSVSPGGVREFVEMWAEIDLRAMLHTVGVPTLVLQRTGDPFRDPAHAGYLAEHIPGATLIELAGGEHAPFLGDSEHLLDEVEEFLTGARTTPDIDRVLATVVFIDIVGSTEHVARGGDRAWRETLERYYALCLRYLQQYRGRQVRTVGDGVLATFDGPARAVRCASAVADAVGALGLQVRAGVHTGECEMVGDDVGGLAVRIGSHVAGKAAAGEVLASSTVRDLVAGSGLRFEDRGETTLTGVPGEWRLYAVAT
ncbi:MAG: adenylate/guanylate cyclase domain-containing protein [Actinobacteria bacterium]|nr:adenylate/guanylate cyclase domain-containing protein [Actinomycetota bacterium]